MEKLNERDLFKIFSFWQERATETVRHDGDVGMHSLYSPSFFFCSLFATLSSVRSFTMCLFHLSAVSRLHYYYQFNTYNTLIPAAVAVTESNRVTTTTTTRITQVLPPAIAATKNNSKTSIRAFFVLHTRNSIMFSANNKCSKQHNNASEPHCLYKQVQTSTWIHTYSRSFSIWRARLTYRQSEFFFVFWKKKRACFFRFKTICSTRIHYHHNRIWMCEMNIIAISVFIQRLCSCTIWNGQTKCQLGENRRISEKDRERLRSRHTKNVLCIESVCYCGNNRNHFKWC